MAAGFAALLNFPRLFREFSLKPVCVLFAFVNEEPPFFYLAQYGQHGVCQSRQAT